MMFLLPDLSNLALGLLLPNQAMLDYGLGPHLPRGQWQHWNLGIRNAGLASGLISWRLVGAQVSSRLSPLRHQRARGGSLLLLCRRNQGFQVELNRYEDPCTPMDFETVEASHTPP